MGESSVSYNYEIGLVGRECTIKWDIPPEKGAVVVVDLRVINFSLTKIRTSNGQIIKLGDEESVTPPVCARFAISTQTLGVPSICKRYILSELANFNVDRSTRDYLAPRILCHAFDLTAHAKGKYNEGKGFKIEGGLIVTREEVVEEMHVLGGLKKEVFKGGDGELSCTVCLEELSSGTECTRTPCSHVFHYGCIVPWLVKNKGCPICRRILLDDHKD